MLVEWFEVHEQIFQTTEGLTEDVIQ